MMAAMIFEGNDNAIGFPPEHDRCAEQSASEEVLADDYIALGKNN